MSGNNSQPKVTEEQVRDFNLLRSQLQSGGFSHVLTSLLPLLPNELTNPKPELPSEPSTAWLDVNGRLWVTNSVLEWFYNGDRFTAAEAAQYLPFTRLVPEKPPVTPGELKEMVTETWTPQEFDFYQAIADYANGNRA